MYKSRPYVIAKLIQFSPIPIQVFSACTPYGTLRHRNRGPLACFATHCFLYCKKIEYICEINCYALRQELWI